MPREVSVTPAEQGPRWGEAEGTGKNGLSVTIMSEARGQPNQVTWFVKAQRLCSQVHFLSRELHNIQDVQVKELCTLGCYTYQSLRL